MKSQASRTIARDPNPHRVDNALSAPVRELYASGYSRDEMKDAIDRIVASVTEETARQLYGKGGRS